MCGVKQELCLAQSPGGTAHASEPRQGLVPRPAWFWLELDHCPMWGNPQGQLWRWQQPPVALPCGAGRRAMQGPGLLGAGTPAANHPHVPRVGAVQMPCRGRVSPRPPDTAEPLGENLVAHVGVRFAKNI